MEAGYDGVISIEHEDPVWEGAEEKVTQALRLGRDLLRPIWRPHD
jgi:sugar phosphate isomerase/epimerase